LLLTYEQKAVLLQKLASKLSSDGVFSVISQRDRSQLSNKEDAITKFYLIISKALTPVKPRKRTRPTMGSVEKRLSGKRIKSEIKQNRQKFDD
jgi:ribosome-associated protein